MNKLFSKVQKRIEQEYRQYKEYKLTKSNKEIFDDAYEISSYTALHDYFTSDCVDETIVKSANLLLKNKGSILGDLYDRYLKTEYATLTTYDDIKDFVIDNYLLKLKQNQEVQND